MAAKENIMSDTSRNPNLFTVSFESEPNANLGVLLQNLDKEEASSKYAPGYASVSKLKDGDSIARRSGLEVGDFLVAVNGLGFRRNSPEFEESEVEDLSNIKPTITLDTSNRFRVIEGKARGKHYDELLNAIKKIKKAGDPSNPLVLSFERHHWDSKANSWSRFFISNDKNEEKAVEMLEDHQGWRDSTFPIDLSNAEIIRVVASGSFKRITSGTSHYPVIFVDMAKVSKLNSSDDIIMKVLAAVVESLLSNKPASSLPKLSFFISVPDDFNVEEHTELLEYIYIVFASNFPGIIHKFVVCPVTDSLESKMDVNFSFLSDSAKSKIIYATDLANALTHLEFSNNAILADETVTDFVNKYGDDALGGDFTSAEIMESDNNDGSSDTDTDDFDLDGFLNEEFISLNTISDDEFGDALRIIEQKSKFKLEEIVSDDPKAQLADDKLGQISKKDLTDAVLELRKQQLSDLDPLELIKIAEINLKSLEATDEELVEAMTRIKEEGNIDLKSLFEAKNEEGKISCKTSLQNELQKVVVKMRKEKGKEMSEKQKRAASNMINILAKKNESKLASAVDKIRKQREEEMRLMRKQKKNEEDVHVIDSLAKKNAEKLASSVDKLRKQREEEMKQLRSKNIPGSPKIKSLVKRNRSKLFNAVELVRKQNSKTQLISKEETEGEVEKNEQKDDVKEEDKQKELKSIPPNEDNVSSAIQVELEDNETEINSELSPAVDSDMGKIEEKMISKSVELDECQREEVQVTSQVESHVQQQVEVDKVSKDIEKSNEGDQAVEHQAVVAEIENDEKKHVVEADVINEEITQLDEKNIIMVPKIDTKVTNSVDNAEDLSLELKQEDAVEKTSISLNQDEKVESQKVINPNETETHKHEKNYSAMETPEPSKPVNNLQSKSENKTNKQVEKKPLKLQSNTIELLAKKNEEKMAGTVEKLRKQREEEMRQMKENKLNSESGKKVIESLSKANEDKLANSVQTLRKEREEEMQRLRAIKNSKQEKHVDGQRTSVKELTGAVNNFFKKDESKSSKIENVNKFKGSKKEVNKKNPLEKTEAHSKAEKVVVSKEVNYKNDPPAKTETHPKAEKVAILKEDIGKEVVQVGNMTDESISKKLDSEKEKIEMESTSELSDDTKKNPASMDKSEKATHDVKKSESNKRSPSNENFASKTSSLPLSMTTETKEKELATTVTQMRLERSAELLELSKNKSTMALQEKVFGNKEEMHKESSEKMKKELKTSKQFSVSSLRDAMTIPLVDFKNNDYRAFVFTVHKEFGIMLLNYRNKLLKRDDCKILGGRILEEEFISSTRVSGGNVEKELINAGKSCAARLVFEETGIDIRDNSGRLVPMNLWKDTQNVPDSDYFCELKKRVYFLLKVNDEDFVDKKSISDDENKILVSEEFQETELTLKLPDSLKGFQFEEDIEKAAELIRSHSGGVSSSALRFAMEAKTVIIEETKKEEIKEKSLFGNLARKLSDSIRLPSQNASFIKEKSMTSSDDGIDEKAVDLLPEKKSAGIFACFRPCFGS